MGNLKLLLIFKNIIVQKTITNDNQLNSVSPECKLCFNVMFVLKIN